MIPRTLVGLLADGARDVLIWMEALGHAGVAPGGAAQTLAGKLPLRWNTPRG